MQSVEPAAARTRAQKRKLLLILLVCALPMVASYLSYYVIKPSARSNYGTLIEPQRPEPALPLQTIDGRRFDLSSLGGRWLLIVTGPGRCDEACVKRLYHMRQVRLTTGKERDRIERVWLITDSAPVDTTLLKAYDGTWFLRAPKDAVQSWLPADANTRQDDHIYIVDPLGHLMMRFPKDADPNRTKKDLAKLLAASSVG